MSVHGLHDYSFRIGCQLNDETSKRAVFNPDCLECHCKIEVDAIKVTQKRSHNGAKYSMVSRTTTYDTKRHTHTFRFSF